MATLGIEMCDAGFQAASSGPQDTQLLTATEAGEKIDWPGFAYYDGQKFWFGQAAEDAWFVHPRRVAHTFWARLTHEPSNLGPVGKPTPVSELAYLFLRNFMERVSAVAASAEKIVLAVPGTYLKDPATEEEKIGLLLGIAAELKLPLAGIVDMACAAVCDSRSPGFNPALPVVVVDLHLEGADLTLLATHERIERKDYLHLPHSGYAQLLKHLVAAMGNRFLRHTAFDILEDGRIEQTFFRQTKGFLLGEATEHRFQINTSSRTYEMLAKREQLAADAQQFVHTLVQGVQTFVHKSPHASESCTIALTHRASRLPGLDARLRSLGFNRLVHLPDGAGACGAARIGENRLRVPTDLGDVAVETAVPISLARCSAVAPWEARLQKVRLPSPRPAPTHVILDGIGHPLGGKGRFTIGTASAGPDVTLPDAFNIADDCNVPLLRDGGRLWFVEPGNGNG
ncbi:MAG: hypothetical protein ABIZ49_13240, partial [Opitutaceae bacterium]